MLESRWPSSAGVKQHRSVSFAYSNDEAFAVGRTRGTIHVFVAARLVSVYEQPRDSLEAEEGLASQPGSPRGMRPSEALARSLPA
jgi:hypothetical protein